jgi:rfaE bifunctional protein kinase chain/domain
MELETPRLRYLLDRLPSMTLAVVGDFFLDKYLVVDPALVETSLETGLEAHQVVEIRLSPGAAGTVTSNLCALGTNVIALGVVGDDGEGLELGRELAARGVDTSQIVRQKGIFTPTYAKPMLRTKDGAERELSRLDVKNRRPIGTYLEGEIIARLRALIPYVHGVVVVDQVAEPNCGVVTEALRRELSVLAEDHPDKPIAAESRSRIGLFRNVMLKPNAHEALKAVGMESSAEADMRVCAEGLFRRAGAPVFITRGEEGILFCDEGGPVHVETLRVTAPTDIVGAGDSTLAGIAASLCAGATRVEAAIVGNLVASVTIRQIGTTGTATPQQVVDAFFELQGQNQSLSRSAQSSSVQSSNEGSPPPLP